MCTTLVYIYPDSCIGVHSSNNKPVWNVYIYVYWVDFTALKSQVQNEETAVNMNNALVEIKV